MDDADELQKNGEKKTTKSPSTGQYISRTIAVSQSPTMMA